MNKSAALPCLAVFVTLLVLLPRQAVSQTCPAASWERVSAKFAGWSLAGLKMADAIAKELDTDSYVVVAGGKVIWEYGDTTVVSNVHSVRKSIASILFGIASDRGQVPLERTLAELGIDDHGGLSPTEQTATIRNLLSARSCIYHKAAYETKEQIGRRPERNSCRPGEQWFYNNWDFNALGSIYQTLTGKTLFDAFEGEIAGPLQLERFKKAEHTQFHKEETSRHPAYLFRLSALDMARIGLLMARGGDWCGKRIVSKRWVDESTTKISDTNRGTGYGYLWWVGEDGRQFGTQFSGRTFSARGQRGQFMIVNPADDLLIVHRVDTDLKGQRVGTREFEELLAAIMAARLQPGVVARAEPFPSGKGEQLIKLQGENLKVFTYRPNCREPSLLIVLHGKGRNADEYRDWARPLADQHCFLVAAPQFDSKRFPTWRYQHGGVAQRGEIQDAKERTGHMVVELAERVRTLEGRKIPYSLIGHSAGGQFLSRLAAFVPTEAQRIVIANPGTHVFPDLKVKAPFGFGAVYPKEAAEAQLRRYLGQPVTIYLGQEDTEDLDEVATAAMPQGATRYERGLNAFKAAQSLAQSRSWAFNWRLVETPGIGHKAEKMFAAKEAWEALKP